MEPVRYSRGYEFVLGSSSIYGRNMYSLSHGWKLSSEERARFAAARDCPRRRRGLTTRSMSCRISAARK